MSQKNLLKDVAKLAGVSPSTVSRCLNGTGGVAEEKRQAIFSAAEQLGVVPPATRTKSTRTLAFVIRRGAQDGIGENTFYSRVLLGAEEQAAKLGYGLLYITVLGNNSGEVGLPKSLISKSVDGVLVVGPYLSQTTRAIAESGLPVISVDDFVTKDIPSVVTDNLGGARAAVKHLAEITGSGDIHIYSGPAEDFSSQERLAGYRCAMAELGYPVKEGMTRLIQGETAWDGYSTAGDRIGKGPIPRAIFCTNDDMAIGLIRWLVEAGVRIPQDVAVMGFDDISTASHIRPTLSTVRVYKEHMGAQAVTKLVGHIKGEFAPSVSIMSTELVFRESAPAVM